MNTANIKAYAPGARRDFIQAVTEKAHLLGLSENQIEPIETRGNVALIAGRPYPKDIGTIRQDLENRISQDGFELTMRKMAYTWFNRFIAIRYMELHDCLDHGYRVLSNRSGSEIPEILEHATDVELPDLNREEVVRLRLAGDEDNTLYQILVVAQCNALNRAMPFLFERIGGSDELLMPDNLLHSNSPVRSLVNKIPEEDWQQIEIIGWIYQFYISEKKDEVIGTVVKSEDIPAATQLFTPNWIVKYMVQNSLGAQWLATYPHSPLQGEMEYYIEPAEQTDEVKAQLAAITPATLNPEELTLIDPACGSGHILVEAYKLFKAIYLERGYRQRDVPQLILEKNLFGLDIDGRAAQLTGFALMMKGRTDDRRLFERGVKLNVMALVDSTGFDVEGVAKGVKLGDYGLQPDDLIELKELFEHATTFGSLIQVPEGLVVKLPALKRLSEAAKGLFLSDALKCLGLLVQQAELLAARYDAVVANPPYMGGQYQTPVLKKYLKDHYRGYERDIFSAFIDRDLTFSKLRGRLGFMSPFVWMFLSAHEYLRTRLINEETVTSLVQLEYSGFDGATVPICTFTLQKSHVNKQKGCYIRLANFRGSDRQGPKTVEAIQNRECGWFFEATQDNFGDIPGSPIAYWIGDAVHNVFASEPSMGRMVRAAVGLQTSNNERFVRLWPEISLNCLSLGLGSLKGAIRSSRKWFPFNKGGEFRKWFGNHSHVVNWENNGYEIRNYRNDADKVLSRPQGSDYYFEESVSWTDVTSSINAFRRYPQGFIHGNTGHSVFRLSRDHASAVLSACNNCFYSDVIASISPTLHFDIGYFQKLPFPTKLVGISDVVIDRLVSLSEQDWNAYERSWDFQSLPILKASTEPTPTLESSYTAWINQNRETIAEMKHLEEENNRLFIDAYGLTDELTPDVPIEQITLTVNPAYRYGGKLTDEELWTRFRQDTMAELVSYAIGCMMGRYSLDEPGLIYASSGNENFDPSRYTTFPADDDGILTLTDTEWFDDDTANRLIEFISVAWGASHLEDNLTFLADNLSPKKNESSRDTIRRYLCDKFFKDHVQTYKKRPIYWLLSSGKQKAFQCLIYLHRYNEATLSRVRSMYVTPLFGNLHARQEYLQNEWDAADSASARKKFQKEIDDMKKKLAELSTFDDELRHYADKQISLDLDDGVKVNYGKFGTLLAEKKKVTGKG
ncbi:BREX-1 system adenine-specific DNA-methyltransferase PglX [Desulforhopalus vacuolatus]|uniref:BREX-1 system adenine-specific DNA-methyltransferase PglX n=1 Tax=Desulforhopalus vacuolatus TaxID=40414 RepID=UPI00196379BE|nr:BREX-1 system adenine-specific DNA-methyltransferase PglX [Desulforhopalus vacuolatus]MBM9518898.1 BREX-1 system adenine-specific DNA-methyltransferase PglX [Desulforhopalus vacuolatus]